MTHDGTMHRPGSPQQLNIPCSAQSPRWDKSTLGTTSPQPVQRSLTNRQEEVLRAIREAIIRTGFPPSRDELEEQLGHEVRSHLEALERKGVLRHEKRKSRTMRVLRVEWPAEVTLESGARLGAVEWRKRP